MKSNQKKYCKEDISKIKNYDAAIAYKTHSADTLINLLKQLVSQNEQIIQLLTKLKGRFI